MRADAALAASSALDPRVGSDAAAAGKQLEAWFVGHLSKELRESMGGGPLGSGAAAMFADYFDRAIGEAVAAGNGIGLAEQIEASIARRGTGLEGARGDAVSAFAAPRSPGGGTRRLDGSGMIGAVTSAFGERHDPFHGERRMHSGVDVAAPVGTPIRAPRDGIVRVAGTRGGYGNVVYLDHGDGTESRYAHCDTLSVKPGQVVRAGEPIATVGATGRATGPHVHLELRSGGRAIDPASLVPHVLGAGLMLPPADTSELP
jgi:murein DD-endopeptidase MepM/ murein hydrolase activator NlpD